MVASASFVMPAVKPDGAMAAGVCAPAGVEPAHGLLVAVEHGDCKRRAAGGVLSLEIGTELDEHVEDVVPLAHHREVQRRQAALEPRHPAIERLRILFDQAANQVEIADGHRRENVVARAALDQQIEEGAPRRVHLALVVARGVIESRPPDHVEGVHVAEPVHVAAGVEQRADGLQVSARSGPVQGYV